MRVASGYGIIKYKFGRKLIIRNTKFKIKIIFKIMFKWLKFDL